MNHATTEHRATISKTPFQREATILLQQAVAALGVQCKPKFDPESNFAFGVNSDDRHICTVLFKQNKVTIRYAPGISDRRVTTRLKPFLPRKSYSWVDKFKDSLSDVVSVMTAHP